MWLLMVDSGLWVMVCRQRVFQGGWLEFFMVIGGWMVFMVVVGN